MLCTSLLGHFRQVLFNTNALPRINIGADVWGESSIMTGVFQRWCSSTLHIGWGLCDRVCQVLVSRGRYGLGGGGSSLHSGIEFGGSRTGEGSSGRKKGVTTSKPCPTSMVWDWSGAARTILRFHMISDKPSKQRRMMGSTLGVYSRRVYLSDTLSTTESEWYAASEPGKELLYLRIIMREFGFPQPGPMHLYEDSRGVIAMAENPSNRKGARHIDTREHFVDQLVKDRIVKQVQCRTNKMVADALTKNLSACWEKTKRRFQR
jgi:hypothetical protein